MTQKPTKLTKPGLVPSSLIGLARRISTPDNYYNGLVRAGTSLPDNILLFHRRNPAEMETSLKSPHFNQRHTIVIPLRGVGRLVIDERRHLLHPGECGLILPYQFHAYAYGNMTSIDWLFVSFDLASTAQAIPPGNQFFRPVDRFWDRLVELVKEYQSAESRAEADRLSCLLFLMLGDMLRTPMIHPPQKHGELELLARVRALAMTNLKHSFSIAEVAGHLKVSESHLRARFRTEAGRSLGEFLRAVRLQHAAQMLSQGRANVTETSLACGWNDPYTFSRAFRAYWKQTPKRFSLLKRQTGYD